MLPRTRQFLCLFLALIVLPSIADAGTILVKPDGTGDYPTIQAGIDAAVPGDEVVLAPGTYTGDGNRDLDYHGKAITVRGTDPTDPAVVVATIIDCQGTQAAPHRGFAFRSGEGPDSILAGLTIQNGRGSDVSSQAGIGIVGGGGILCDGTSPTIRDCVVRNCTGPFGGGICCVASSIAIERCTISNNAADNGTEGTVTDGGPGGDGGGIHAIQSSLTVHDCTFTGNKAGSGGQGIGSYMGGGAGGHGGGIWCESITMSGCTITGNRAGRGGDVYYPPRGQGGRGGHGGGMYCGAATITDCAISGNSAGDSGYGEPSVAGSGGGIYCVSSATLERCAINGNGAGAGTNHVMPGEVTRGSNGGSGGGIRCAGFLTVRNCQIVGNWAGRGGGGPSSNGLGYTNSRGGAGGSGGGISCGDAAVSDSQISNNRSGGSGYGEISVYSGGSGGGINAGSLTLLRCSITGNSTGSGGGSMNRAGKGGDGGGICCSAATVQQCVVAGNSTGKGGDNATNYAGGYTGSGGDGGGVYCTNGTIDNCLIVGNTTGPGGSCLVRRENPGGDGGRGAGVYCPVATLTSCTIISNVTGAGGTSHGSAPNGSQGLYGGTNGSAYNSIVAGNSPTDITGSISYCWTGDPTGLFLDPLGLDNDPATWQDNNYHLVAGSPCINAGDLAFAPQPGETDLDGHPRVMGGAVDLGADEWTWPGDVNGDSHVDAQDLLLLVAAFGTSIPQPAYARTCDFNGDGAIDVVDLLYLVENWGK